MDRVTGNNESVPACAASQAIDENAKRIVLLELDKILNNKLFRGSSRSKQFLSYVVRNGLDGRLENLKERMIGTEVFQRHPDYATGDDSVVRVSAGEVRRRLEKYYSSAPNDTPVRIEIPIGSYAPEFRWSSTTAPLENHPRISESAANVLQEQGFFQSKKARLGLRLAVCLGFALAALLVTFGMQRQQQPVSAASMFWAPALSSPRPVLICLYKPVVYRPTLELYERYSQGHPGQFVTEPQRLNEELPLDPNDTVSWKEMEVYPEFGLATGDVHAGFSISSLLAQKGKTSDLKIGSNCSFEDLRVSPSVVIGAYNNRWTMQMASNLHFAFQWDPGMHYYPRIKENVPSGRVWTAKFGPHFNYSVDYGVVTRLVDSDTGNLLISIGGLGTTGTQAAGELIADPQHLDDALRNAPRDWNKKNLQIVVETKVTDAIPSPPHVVATYLW